MCFPGELRENGSYFHFIFLTFFLFNVSESTLIPISIAYLIGTFHRNVAQVPTHFHFYPANDDSRMLQNVKLRKRNTAKSS